MSRQKKTFRAILLLLTAASLVFIGDCQVNSCPTEDEVVEQFNHLSEAALGYHCNVEVHDHDDDHSEDDHHSEDDDHSEDDHHSEDDDHSEDDHHSEDDDHHSEDDHKDEFHNSTVCNDTYYLVRGVILAVSLTTEDCLEGHSHTEGDTTVSRAEAYGYGLLMVIVVCLGSVLGVFLVPLIKSDSRVGRQLYEYVYAFMIAIGASALVSDAILHLIPHAFGLHGHEHDTEHSSSEHETEDIEFIWKGVIVLLGLYIFFLLEVALHGLGDYLKEKSKNKSEHCSNVHFRCPADDVHFTSEVPTDQKNELPADKIGLSDDSEDSTDEIKVKAPKLCDLSCQKIKPVAWLIIIGDAVHNFADGLALGAAISQSVALGVSTMFALIFHEIPHELGDYVILIKSGLHWITALGFNVLSSLSALVGLLVGVAISDQSDAANGWILAGAAGFFLYISLTDLLPELIHGGGQVKETKKGWRFAIRFTLANFGMLLSFVVLLLLAIYEEQLTQLI